LALDAYVIQEPNHKEFSLSEFFSLRSNFPKESIISSIIFPENQHFCFTYVARTPVDLPIVCAALSTWNNGRVRLVIGGYGTQPLLVADGDISDDISSAAYSAYSNAQDEWASAEYRSEMAKVLSRRCLSILNSEA
jgi:CO/xanthine dehydrogenase FAD-binding subunit